MVRIFDYCYPHYIVHIMLREGYTPLLSAQRTQRSQNVVQYVVNPVFDEEKTYEVPVTQQQKPHHNTLHHISQKLKLLNKTYQQKGKQIQPSSTAVLVA